MSSFTRSSEGSAIVVLGSLNPAIFNPGWLERHGLVSSETTDAANVEIVRNEIAALELDWLRLEVTRQKFLARTEEASHFGSLRDLVVGVFSLLSHTPVFAVGLNYWAHYAAHSESEWHRFGYWLAPRQPWEKMFGPARHSGLQELTIEIARNDQRKGFLRVTAAPSRVTRPGVFLHINDHYQLAESDDPVSGEQVLEVIKENFESSLLESRRVVETMISHSLQG